MEKEVQEAKKEVR
jgi:hypothetical protein